MYFRCSLYTADVKYGILSTVVFCYDIKARTVLAKNEKKILSRQNKNEKKVLSRQNMLM